MITWWNEEEVPEKGTTSNSCIHIIDKFENYRSISLLNTLYKMFAALLQLKIPETLNSHLQKTQYGLRTIQVQQMQYN